MHLSKMFIDRVYLDYDGFETVSDRQQYQERMAEELYFKHLGAIKKVMEEPEFYIKAESKMNDIGFLSGMWEDLIQEHGSDEAKLRSDEILMSFPEIKKLNEKFFRAAIIKPQKKYNYPKPVAKKQPEAEKPAEKFVRSKGGYSNTQWNDISEDDIGK